MPWSLLVKSVRSKFHNTFQICMRGLGEPCFTLIVRVFVKCDIKLGVCNIHRSVFYVFHFWFPDWRGLSLAWYEYLIERIQILKNLRLSFTHLNWERWVLTIQHLLRRFRSWLNAISSLFLSNLLVLLILRIIMMACGLASFVAYVNFLRLNNHVLFKSNLLLHRDNIL